MSSKTHKRKSKRKMNKTQKKKTTVPIKYIPKRLSRKDRKIVKEELKKSRRLYKKGKYHTRKAVKSYPEKESKYMRVARKMYNVEDIKSSKELAKATGCSVKALLDIEKKGMGAY